MMAASTASKGRPRDRRLGILFLTLFIDLAGFSIIFPLYPAMLQHYLEQSGENGLFGQILGLLSGLVPGSVEDPAWVTTVFFGAALASLYSLTQFLSAPIWGRLSDRLGRRQVLLWTIAGTCVSHLLWAFGNTFGLFILSRLLAGCFAGNLGVVTAAVADITPSEKRSSGMAIIGVAFGLGFILGPALGGGASLVQFSREPATALLSLHLFSAPALLAAALSLINLLQVWRNFTETLPESRRRSSVKATVGIPSGKESWVQRRLGSTVALRHTVLLYGLFILAFSGMEFTLTFLAVERLHFSPARNALLFLYIGTILLLVQGWFVRRYAHTLGEKKLLGVGLLCSGAGLGLLALAHSTAAFFGGLTLLGIGMGLASPLFSSLTSLYSPAENQGQNLGLMRSAGSLARAVGPLLTGMAFWMGGSTPAYLAGAAAMLLLAAASRKLPALPES
jgi:MFS family permease